MGGTPAGTIVTTFDVNSLDSDSHWIIEEKWPALIEYKIVQKLQKTQIPDHFV
jgi:hypothetical protein